MTLPISPAWDSQTLKELRRVGYTIETREDAVSAVADAFLIPLIDAEELLEHARDVESKE